MPKFSHFFRAQKIVPSVCGIDNLISRLIDRLIHSYVVFQNFDRSNISLNGSWAKRVEDKMTAGWSDSQIELLHWFTGRKVFPATEEVETQTLEPEGKSATNSWITI